MQNNILKLIGFILLLSSFLIVLPHFLEFEHQDLLIFLVINVLIVVSYRLMTLTGEWSLIHVIMMGVGAYTSALLTKNFDLSFWLSLPLAGLMSGLLAALFCFPLFRMSQFYFLIGSFAVGESIRLIWIYFIKPFGGSSGLNSIPIPELGRIDFFYPINYYYLVLIFVSLCLIILYRVENSRIGLTLHAVHWKSALAESVGINTWYYRSLAFIIASFFVGLAGSLKVHYIGSLTPHQFDIETMLFILIWVIVGGYRTFYGPIIGAIILTICDEILRVLGPIRPAFYGLLLIFVVLFLPKGLENIYLQAKNFFLNIKKANV